MFVLFILLREINSSSCISKKKTVENVVTKKKDFHKKEYLKKINCSRAINRQ